MNVLLLINFTAWVFEHFLHAVPIDIVRSWYYIPISHVAVSMAHGRVQNATTVVRRLGEIHAMASPIGIVKDKGLLVCAIDP